MISVGTVLLCANVAPTSSQIQSQWITQPALKQSFRTRQEQRKCGCASCISRCACTAEREPLQIRAGEFPDSGRPGGGRSPMWCGCCHSNNFIPRAEYYSFCLLSQRVFLFVFLSSLFPSCATWSPVSALVFGVTHGRVLDPYLNKRGRWRCLPCCGLIYMQVALDFRKAYLTFPCAFLWQ